MAARTDLLSACLRVVNLEDEIDVMDKHGIDAFTLKILNRDDLDVLGITDISKQDFFLATIDNLDLPSEEAPNVKIDERYIKFVCYIINSQLDKHLASLSCALMREDVVVNDVRLMPALKCLEQSMVSLEKKSKRCRIIINKPPNKNWNKYLIYTVAVGTFLTGSLILIQFTFL